MEVLWKKSPQTALEVVQQLMASHPWQDQTIRTMLRRLVAKKVVTYRADGKIYYYSAAVDRNRCVQQESRSFLNRIFEGSAQPLLLQLVQETKLSRKEIAELKAILTSKEKSS